MSQLSRRKWISIPTISIPWAGPSIDPNGTNYIVRQNSQPFQLLIMFLLIFVHKFSEYIHRDTN
jgi:hypothetical protein